MPTAPRVPCYMLRPSKPNVMWCADWQQVALSRAATKPGSYVGGRPSYGYRAQGHELTIDPGEAEIVRRIYMLARDGKSIREIRTLIDAEDPARDWHRTAIERILKRDV